MAISLPLLYADMSVLRFCSLTIQVFYFYVVPSVISGALVTSGWSFVRILSTLLLMTEFWVCSIMLNAC